MKKFIRTTMKHIKNGDLCFPLLEVVLATLTLAFLIGWQFFPPDDVPYEFGIIFFTILLVGSLQMRQHRKLMDTLAERDGQDSGEEVAR